MIKPPISFVGISLLAVLTVGILWSWWDNTHPVTTHYSLNIGNGARGGYGVRIVHLSDLHIMGRPEFYQDILRRTQESKPDAIMISGDIIDRRIVKIDQTLSFTGALATIAPVYFTPGNHEMACKAYPQLVSGLKKQGVHVLEDQWADLTIENTTVKVCGLRDIFWYGDSDGWKETTRKMTEPRGSEDVVILLAHRGRLFPELKKYPIDLVLSGHSHGGLIRWGNRGWVEPKQGIVPSYTGGVYGDGPWMVQSRGIGNTSIMPLRINNPPEVVVIDF